MVVVHYIIFYFTTSFSREKNHATMSAHTKHTAPEPTAPNAIESFKDKDLETLIEEATSIAALNGSIIEEIKLAKEYHVICYHIDTEYLDNSVKFNVSEAIKTLDFEELRRNWRVSPEHQMVSITPDLFRDCINYECNTLDDIIKVNCQMLECCKKYWFLDEAKASPVILKFIKNFELLQASLDSVRESYLKPKPQYEQICAHVSAINKSIGQLSTLPMVLFQRESQIAGSQILDNKMRGTLSHVLEAKPLTFLTSSAQIGSTAPAFDAVVQGKGPFVLLIQAASGHVFGAYVPEEFSSKTGWLPCRPDLVLFSLGNLTGTPLKLLPVHGAARMHFGRCGLHVGQNSGLVCFCSHSCGHFPESEWTAAPGYPSDRRAGALCGTPGLAVFTPQLMEIFVVAPAPASR
jgi:hypothetical protein